MYVHTDWVHICAYYYCIPYLLVVAYAPIFSQPHVCHPTSTSTSITNINYSVLSKEIHRIVIITHAAIAHRHRNHSSPSSSYGPLPSLIAIVTSAAIVNHRPLSSPHPLPSYLSSVWGSKTKGFDYEWAFVWFGRGEWWMMGMKVNLLFFVFDSAEQQL